MVNTAGYLISEYFLAIAMLYILVVLIALAKSIESILKNRSAKSSLLVVAVGWILVVLFTMLSIRIGAIMFMDGLLFAFLLAELYWIIHLGRRQ